MIAFFQITTNPIAVQCNAQIRWLFRTRSAPFSFNTWNINRKKIGGRVRPYNKRYEAFVLVRLDCQTCTVFVLSSAVLQAGPTPCNGSLASLVCLCYYRSISRSAKSIHLQASNASLTRLTLSMPSYNGDLRSIGVKINIVVTVLKLVEKKNELKSIVNHLRVSLNIALTIV